MWNEEHESQIRSRESRIETAKFGFPIRRVFVGSKVLDDTNGLIEACSLRHQNETVFLKFDSGQHWVRNYLSQYPEQVIPTPDTQFWMKPHSVKRASTPIEKGSKGRSISRSQLAERDDIESLVKVIFSSYRNHYSSNPKLHGIKPVEAYVDWALSKLNQNQEGSTFLLKENSKNVGYALVETQLNAANVLLAGVVPEVEGTGAYQDFLRLLTEQTNLDTYISTQTDNIRVQRSWVAAGFKPSRAFSTVHLQGGPDFSL
jgi:hypothetical protein